MGGASSRVATETPSKRGLSCDIRRRVLVGSLIHENEASGRVGGNGTGCARKKITRFLATRGPELVPAKFNSASNNFTAIGVVAMVTTGGSPVNSSRGCRQYTAIGINGQTSRIYSDYQHCRPPIANGI